VPGNNVTEATLQVGPPPAVKVQWGEAAGLCSLVPAGVVIRAPDTAGDALDQSTARHPGTAPRLPTRLRWASALCATLVEIIDRLHLEHRSEC
jgi:hypothetical protein